MEVNKIPYFNQIKKTENHRSPKIDSVSTYKLIQSSDSVSLSSKNDFNVVLNAIKAKVNQGFYKSEEVTEDITEKLARLFDRS